MEIKSTQCYFNNRKIAATVVLINAHSITVEQCYLTTLTISYLAPKIAARSYGDICGRIDETTGSIPLGK
jgi:hypothetical protein